MSTCLPLLATFSSSLQQFFGQKVTKVFCKFNSVYPCQFAAIDNYNFSDFLSECLPFFFLFRLQHGFYFSFQWINLLGILSTTFSLWVLIFWISFQLSFCSLYLNWNNKRNHKKILFEKGWVRFLAWIALLKNQPILVQSVGVWVIGGISALVARLSSFCSPHTLQIINPCWGERGLPATHWYSSGSCWTHLSCFYCEPCSTG